MSGALALLGGAASGLIGGLQNFLAREDFYNFEREKMRYNSIRNQVDQWKRAGLNPNSFNGGFVSQSGQPPQPTSLLNSVSSAFQSAASLRQQRQLAQMNNDVQREELALRRDRLEIDRQDAAMRREMHDISLKQAKQAFEQGNIRLAMAKLDYAYAFATHDERLQMFHDSAAISKEHARRYPEYYDAFISNLHERNHSLRHSRRIADQRLVFDYNRMYADDAYRYSAMSSLDSYRNRSLDIAQQRADESDDYHRNYLDYLQAKADHAYQERNWRMFHDAVRSINYYNNRSRGFSPRSVKGGYYTRGYKTTYSW